MHSCLIQHIILFIFCISVELHTSTFPSPLYVLTYFNLSYLCTMRRRYSAVKVMSGNIEPATLRRKTFSGKDLELVVSVEKKEEKSYQYRSSFVHSVTTAFHYEQNGYLNSTMYSYSLTCLDTYFLMPAASLTLTL